MYLIFGAGGFIGREFTRFCDENGHAYLTVSARSISQVDLVQASENVTHIFNFSGLTRGTFEELINANLRLSARIIDALVKTRSKAKLILFGSASEYGKCAVSAESNFCDPISEYGFIKLQQTNLLKFAKSEFGISGIVVRPFNVVGRGMPPGSAIQEILSKLRFSSHSSNIVTGPLNVVRDYVSLQDLVRCTHDIAMHQADIEIVNICSGFGTSLKEIVELAKAKYNPNIVIDEDPQIVGSNSTQVSVGVNDLLCSITTPPAILSPTEILQLIVGE